MAFKECSNGMKESSVYQEINPQMVQLIKKPMCVGQTGSGLKKKHDKYDLLPSATEDDNS